MKGKSNWSKKDLRVLGHVMYGNFVKAWSWMCKHSVACSLTLDSSWRGFPWSVADFGMEAAFHLIFHNQDAEIERWQDGFTGADYIHVHNSTLPLQVSWTRHLHQSWWWCWYFCSWLSTRAVKNAFDDVGCLYLWSSLSRLDHVWFCTDLLSFTKPGSDSSQLIGR